MATIRETLNDFNLWWKGDFKLEFKKREIYKKLSKFIDMPQIVALIGLRRVGKTTIMKKIIEDFLKKGYNARNIVYFSFDEFKGIEIREVIKEYEEIAEKNFKEGKYLLLLDEIQKLENWENQLKTIYDLYKENVKIIISGSESLFIRKKSKETLSGRIFEFKVEPLTFREFLLFKDAKIEPIGIYEKELKKLFEEFTLIQGFPELVGIKEKEIIKKYIKESIVDKIIYKDIPALFKVKIFGLSKEMRISRQTLSNYLSYLEESFLIRKLYNFAKSRRKVERKLKRYYPLVASVDLIFKEEELSKSKVFEWLMVNQLKGEFFWRDSNKDEVDIVKIGKKIIPIEIKYGKIDLHGISSFMDKFQIREGFVISPDKETKQKLGKKQIFIIPAFKFLLKDEKEI